MWTKTNPVPFGLAALLFDNEYNGFSFAIFDEVSSNKGTRTFHKGNFSD